MKTPGRFAILPARVTMAALFVAFQGAHTGLQADMVLLEDHRSVSASTSAYIAPVFLFVDPETGLEIWDEGSQWSEAVSHAPATPFGSFDATARASASGYAEASQRSSLSTSTMTGSGEVGAAIYWPGGDVGSGPIRLFASASGSADSCFKVRFLLTTPQAYDFHGTAGGYNDSGGFQLSMADGSVIFTGGDLDVSGMLEAGTYELMASMGCGGGAKYRAESWYANGGYAFTFTVVPEGGNAGLLLAGAALMLAILGRRNGFARTHGRKLTNELQSSTFSPGTPP